MALTHTAAGRNAAADAVVDLIDLGAADANGDLVYMDSGDVQVALLGFSNPAYANSAAGIAQENPISDETNAAGGTIAKFKIQDRDNNEIVRGTVTATGGGGDIELTSVVVAVGEALSTTDLPYTATT